MSKKKRFLVLEMEGDFVKAGLLEYSNGSVVITDLAVLPRKELNAGNIKKMKGFRWHRKNTIILIPPKKVIIRYLELPSRDRRELKEMINFQLPRYLPANLSDFIYDFRIVEEKKEGYTKVMVVCIQVPVLKEILDMAPYLEDSLYGVFLSGETGVDFLRFSQKDKKEVQALVDISGEEVILSIFDPSGLLFMRSLNPAFFNHEENYSRGWEELERTFMGFSREFVEKKIKSVTITGTKAYAPSFYRFIKERNPQPMELFDPFAHVQLHREAEKKVSGELKISFQAIIGAGMEPAESRMNLILPGILSKKEKQLRKKNRLVMVSLTTIIAGQLFFMGHREIAKKKAYLTRLLDEIKIIRPRARGLEDRQKKTELIKGQLEAEGSALEIVREIYHIMPPGISINILIFEKANSLSLRGTARSMSEVFNLIPLLEKCPYFEKVVSEGTKMRKIKGEEAADFQLKAYFKKTKK